jgi:hypothetical protein
MDVEMPREVKCLRIKVLPMLPAVVPAGRRAGGIERESAAVGAVRAVDLDERVDAQLVELAERVLEIDGGSCGEG